MSSSYTLQPDGTILIHSGAIRSLKPIPELAGLIQRGVFPHNIPVVLELHDGRRLIGTSDHCNHVFCADDPVQGLSLGRFINEIANACTDPSITIEAKNLVHDSNGRTYVDLHYTNANKTYEYERIKNPFVPAGTPLVLTLCAVGF